MRFFKKSFRDLDDLYDFHIALAENWYRSWYSATCQNFDKNDKSCLEDVERAIQWVSKNFDPEETLEKQFPLFVFAMSSSRENPRETPIHHQILNLSSDIDRLIIIGKHVRGLSFQEISNLHPECGSVSTIRRRYQNLIKSSN